MPSYGKRRRDWGLSDHQWVFAALALVTLLAAANIAIGSTDFSGVLIIGPLVASTQVSRRETAAVALVTVSAAAAAAVATNDDAGIAAVLRLTGVASASGFSVAAAGWRQQREQRLVRLARLADVAQSAILRPLPKAIGPIGIASHYMSAAEEATIGGDFYEAIETPWGVRFIVGDVKGKGLPAVHTASHVLGAFRIAALQSVALDEVARVLNEAVARQLDDEDFVTALFVEVHDDGSLVVVNCGNHPPIAVDASGPRLITATSDPPLGIAGAFNPSAWPGGAARLVLYTDGLVEARAPDGRFLDFDRILCAVSAAGPIDDCISAVVRLLHEHTAGALMDDVAVVAVDLTAVSDTGSGEGERRGDWRRCNTLAVPACCDGRRT